MRVLSDDLQDTTKLFNTYHLDFSFKEYCFGNTWALKWDGNKWCGDNIQGRINPKIVRKCNMRAQKDGYGATGCYCMVKKDTWNSQHIPSNSNRLAFSLFENSMRYLLILMLLQLYIQITT